MAQIQGWTVLGTHMYGPPEAFEAEVWDLAVQALPWCEERLLISS